MAGSKIICAQKETHAAAGLIANRGALLFVRGFGKQQATAFARAYYHPTLAAAHIDILEQHESELANIKGYGAVVVRNDQRSEGERVSGHTYQLTAAANPGPRPSA